MTDQLKDVLEFIAACFAIGGSYYLVEYFLEDYANFRESLTQESHDNQLTAKEFSVKADLMQEFLSEVRQMSTETRIEVERSIGAISVELDKIKNSVETIDNRTQEYSSHLDRALKMNESMLRKIEHQGDELRDLKFRVGNLMSAK